MCEPWYKLMLVLFELFSYFRCSYLALHWVGVDLAHVAASVLLLHAPDVQVPGAEVVVRNGHAGVVCDDVVVNGLDGLGVRLHPADLQQRRA